MIRLADCKQQLEQAQLLDPAGGCAVNSLYSCYNGYSFIDFYIHEQDGQIKGSLCRYDGSVTVCCDSDSDEMVEFLLTLGGFSAADLPVSLARKLQEVLGGTAEEYVLMEAVGKYPLLAEPCERTDDIYNTNKGAGCACGDRTAWTADFSHRLRHGGAAAFCTYIGGRPAACTAVTHISKRYGIIGYVATLPEYRGRGLAGGCVSTAAAYCLDKGITPLVVCKAELVPFYSSLGFREIGSRAGLYLTDTKG